MVALERINYTGRIDLQDHEVEATYQIVDEQFDLTLKWLIGHYGLPEDCKLFFELTGGSTTEKHRFEIGDLGDGLGEKQIRIPVRNPDLITLRFIVVLDDERGFPLIKAQKGGIIPRNLGESNRSRSFLKIVKTSDLTVPWRVEINEDEPILRITDREELFIELRDVSRLFKPSILPDVVRQVFELLATSDVDFSNRTVKQWIKYFASLSCPSDFFESSHSRGDEEQYNEVVQLSHLVSEEFSKKYKILPTIKSIFEPEESR